MVGRITIQISRTDLRQVLDGLQARANQWTALAAQLRGEETTGHRSHPESDNPAECDEIAGHYRDILNSLDRQFEAALTVDGAGVRDD